MYQDVRLDVILSVHDSLMVLNYYLDVYYNNDNYYYYYYYYLKNGGIRNIRLVQWLIKGEGRRKEKDMVDSNLLNWHFLIKLIN